MALHLREKACFLTVAAPTHDLPPLGPSPVRGSDTQIAMAAPFTPIRASSFRGPGGAPVYNHLHDGSGADYQAPAEYDHLNRGPAGGQAYEVALPDVGAEAAGGSSRYVQCAALLHHAQPGPRR